MSSLASLQTETTSEKPLLSYTIRLSLPLFIIVSACASVCIMIGLLWDISWHYSIGRDSFLSPPHIAIYLGGLLAGVGSGIHVLKSTFWGTARDKQQSVKVWGTYGALGAYFCIWGAFAMLTSAPFDDWWHNTFGLDVKILSPPHSLLGLGIFMLQLGAIISALGLQNRLEANAVHTSSLKLARVIYIITAGLLLVMLFTLFSDSLAKGKMHGVKFYMWASAIFPFFLIAFAKGSNSTWPAAKISLVYMIFIMLLVWILPLFPAEPKLGPIKNHITRFQPFHFPLLLVIPGLVIDYATSKIRARNKWFQAIVLGLFFLLTIFIVQWNFGNFLLSPYSRNWFFAADSWYYGSDPSSPLRYAFRDEVTNLSELLTGLFFAFIYAIISSGLGLSFGNWMRRLQR